MKALADIAPVRRPVVATAAIQLAMLIIHDPDLADRCDDFRSIAVEELGLAPEELERAAKLVMALLLSWRRTINDDLGMVDRPSASEVFH